LKELPVEEVPVSQGDELPQLLVEEVPACGGEEVLF